MSLVEKIYQDIHEIKEEKGQKRDLTLNFMWGNVTFFCNYQFLLFRRKGVTCILRPSIKKSRTSVFLITTSFETSYDRRR